MDEKKFALFAWMRELHCFAWMKHLFICLQMRTFDRKPVFKLKTNNANKLNFSVILLNFPKGQLSNNFRGIMGRKCWLKVGKKYIKACYLFWTRLQRKNDRWQIWHEMTDDRYDNRWIWWFFLITCMNGFLKYKTRF